MDLNQEVSGVCGNSDVREFVQTGNTYVRGNVERSKKYRFFYETSIKLILNKK